MFFAHNSETCALCGLSFDICTGDFNHFRMLTNLELTTVEPSGGYTPVIWRTRLTFHVTLTSKMAEGFSTQHS
jgi:hypothetical protein